jgi:hypothetical protein
MRFSSMLARMNGLSGELRAASYFSFARLSGLDLLSDFFPRLAPGAIFFCPLRGLSRGEAATNSRRFGFAPFEVARG